jgi:osmotically inducible protein OsmC
MEPLYTAVAHATGDGRNGHTRTDDRMLDLDLRVPTAMGGPGGATNPEQLFAAGYAACFHSALKVVAQRDKLDVSDSEVSATVGIGMLPNGGFGLEVELDVHVPALDQASSGGAGRSGPRGLPVLERDPRQHRREAQRRLGRTSAFRGRALPRVGPSGRAPPP